MYMTPSKVCGSNVESHNLKPTLRITVVLLTLAVVLIAPLSHVWADQAKMDASVEAIIKGDGHMVAKAYQKAVDAYRLAYDIYPQPELLELIAKAYEALSQTDSTQCPKAEKAWRDVLRVCGDCEQKGMALGKVNTVSKRCEILAKATTKVAPKPNLTAIPPASATPPRAWVGWTTGSLGVASLITGVGFHLSAASTADDINQRDRSVYNRDVNTIESRELGAWISYGVGGALITTALILMHNDSTSSVHLPNGRSQAWGWSF
jgi:hypothetical protein